MPGMLRIQKQLTGPSGPNDLLLWQMQMREELEDIDKEFQSALEEFRKTVQWLRWGQVADLNCKDLFNSIPGRKWGWRTWREALMSLRPRSSIKQLCGSSTTGVDESLRFSSLWMFQGSPRWHAPSTLHGHWGLYLWSGRLLYKEQDQRDVPSTRRTHSSASLGRAMPGCWRGAAICYSILRFNRNSIVFKEHWPKSWEIAQPIHMCLVDLKMHAIMSLVHLVCEFLEWQLGSDLFPVRNGLCRGCFVTNVDKDRRCSYGGGCRVWWPNDSLLFAFDTVLLA